METTNSVNTVANSQIVLMSDNMNYLLTKAKEVMTQHHFDNLELVYDSVLNKTARTDSFEYNGTDESLQKVKELLDTSAFKVIEVKGITGQTLEGNNIMETEIPKRRPGRPSTKKISANVTDDNKSNQEVTTEKLSRKNVHDNSEKETKVIKRGAPALSDEVLEKRYEVLSEYVNGTKTAEEAMKELNVTNGVFRNLVSEYNKCKRLNRKKAFGKTGIMKRVYQMYSEDRISSNRAASMLGISVATFLSWYKADTGNTEIGRGRKKTKNK